ncbi:MAG: DUF4148 domain-containing protein [Rubrivivax sp.]|nr:DUF4148 domain-containing protein [Rubrivivax sp.]MDP3614838.1 DUF4148 domain-containing protein [Rubrivivax sp.]
MKTTTLFAALALTLAASGAALAQEATYEYPQQVTSQTSRANVMAEVQQARANGTLQINHEVANTRSTPAVSTLTRAEVKAQTLAAIASGEVAYLNRDNNDFQAKSFAAPAGVRMAAR